MMHILTKQEGIRCFTSIQTSYELKMKLVQSSDTQVKQRWDYLDAAKGIGMLAVILGHMNLGNLNIFLFSFHMPLFFIISGCFFHVQERHNFIIKRKKQLLLPYIFTWGCIILLAILREIIIVILRGGNLFSSIQEAVIRWGIAGALGSGWRTDYLWIHFDYFIGAIWFLLAMFWAGLLVNALMKYKYGGVVIIILGGISLISAKFLWIPWSIQPAAVAAVFILIGCKLKENIRCLKNIRVIVSCFGIWSVYLSICYLTNTKIGLASAIMPWWIFDFVGSTAATICIIWLSEIICHNTKVSRLKSFLEWFGRNSLIVLCFHLIELNLFPWWIVGNFIGNLGISPLLVQLIIYAAKIIWACMSVIVVHKVTMLRHIFLYNR